MMNEIYPLTVTLDRYGGTYSGGNYTAWNLEPYDIPSEICADDVTVFDFWLSNDITVGKGKTVQEAIDDLARKINE